MTSFFRQRATLDDASAVRLAHSLLFPDIYKLFSLKVEFQCNHDAVLEWQRQPTDFWFYRNLDFFHRVLSSLLFLTEIFGHVKLDRFCLKFFTF